jgi:molybdopterin-synthase adenylyltransferase
MLRRANDLHLIVVDDARVVAKRGLQELLLEGPEIDKIVEMLGALLDGTRNQEEILTSFPDEQREYVASVLSALIARRMLRSSDHPGSPSLTGDGERDLLQDHFYANFGPLGAGAVDHLKMAHVVVYGVNLITRALVPALAEMGVVRITLAEHPILDDRLVDHDWVNEAQSHGSTPVRVLDGATSPPPLDETSLLIATSDFGRAGGLGELNRAALGAKVRFLPAWVEEMVGYVGPLVYPFETACLRCYDLRVLSNDPRPDISPRVRAFMSSEPSARPGTGLLPPMAAIVGQIAAMEAVKAVSEFAPSDAVGRSIEVNLVSFNSTVRRVLKVPRCPDCSRVMSHTTRVLEHGPQIPYRQ